MGRPGGNDGKSRWRAGSNEAGCTRSDGTDDRSEHRGAAGADHMTERFTTYCVFEDAFATRAMIKAGGGTVVSSEPMKVTDRVGNPVAGFAVGDDLPVWEPSS